MIVLGIDESYTRTGIAIVNSSGIINAFDVDFKGCKDKTSKRKLLKNVIINTVKQYKPDIIVCERIRLFSQKFISQNYIKSTAALIACLVDEVYPLKIYSVDTQVWKARVCGHKKGKTKGDKDVSVRYILNKFNLKFNDDICDAICIAEMGLNFSVTNKLFKEES